MPDSRWIFPLMADDGGSVILCVSHQMWGIVMGSALIDLRDDFDSLWSFGAGLAKRIRYATQSRRLRAYGIARCFGWRCSRADAVAARRGSDLPERFATAVASLTMQSGLEGLVDGTVQRATRRGGSTADRPKRRWRRFIIAGPEPERSTGSCAWTRRKDLCALALGGALRQDLPPLDA